MLTVVHLWQPFQEFVFMRRALLGGLVLACSTAPLGVFLILRRMSLIGDAVAHGILPGAALGFWFAGLSLPALTIGGLGAGLSMAGLAAWITRRTGLREDASLAAIYPISLASGVLILGIADQAHAPQDQKHPKRSGAARQNETTKQRPAHEDEFVERLPKLSGGDHQATCVWGCWRIRSVLGPRTQPLLLINRACGMCWRTAVRS